MTIENKKVQTANYEQNNYKPYAKNKIGKSLNANEKSAEFYIGLTLAIYFQMLGEQKH